METTSGCRQVLDALKRHGPRTARELARLLGVGPVVVRAHLRTLLGRGLVEHETARQAVGRPTRRFRLTAASAAHFPQQYERFAVELADEVGEEALGRVLSGWGERLEAHLAPRLPQDPDRRLAALVAHQSHHGFMAAVRSDERGLDLIERHCPIASLATRHPEICRHEAALFERLLGRRTTLAACQALGSECCVFRIGPAPEKSQESHVESQSH